MRAHGHRIAPPGYTVEGPLGEGGFGEVLAARRDADGTPVAIKLAHDHVPLAHARLEREADAYARVGPPIAPRVLEVGRAGGRPFVVLERLVTPSLAARIAQGPIGAREAIAIGDALSAALAGVHARGIIHRDLKPGHVFFDGRAARLIDFGLAAPTGASTGLTGEGDALGTAEYLAPELCAGARAPDARADLYAVGVILYELLTGRVPFSGARADVLAAQLERRPPRPSRSAPVPPALEAIVLRCLAKDPSRRFASAEVLRAALAAVRDQAPAQISGGAALPAADRAQSKISPPANAHAERREMPPANAHAERRAARTMALLRLDGDGDLGRVAELAERAGGRLAQLSGTRLVYAFDVAGAHPVRAAAELARELLRLGLVARAAIDLGAVFERRRGGAVRLAAPPFCDQGSAWSGLRIAPAAAATLPGGEPAELVGRGPVLDALIASARAALDGWAPAIVTVIAEGGLGKTALANALAARLAALGEIVRLTPDAPPAESAAARAALLHRRAERRPLCVLLDDAHRAPGAVLDALELAALAEPRAPIWICALARPALVERRRDFGRGAASSERVALEPLAAADTEELFRRLLAPAEHIPRAALERLAGRARGNPLLITQLASALHRGGHVRPAPRGPGFHLATDELDRWPSSPELGWLVDGELAALDPALAAHAGLCALFEGGLDADALAAVLDELLDGDGDGDGDAFPLDARAGIARLERAGLLDRDGARVRFRHELMRDQIAARVDGVLAARVHRAAFQLLSRAERPAPDEAASARIAVHAARAGLHAEAAARFHALAEQARARHAHVDAENYFSRALEQLALTPEAHDGDAAESSRAESSRAESARAESSRAESSRAESAARSRCLAHRGRGDARARSGRYRESLDDFEAARTLARAAGDRRLEAEILLDQATALDWMNELERARALVEEADALAPRPRPRELEARLLTGRGRSAWRENRWTEARATLEAAAALATAEGAYESRVASLLMLGHLLPALGAPAEAERAFDEVMALCRARDDRQHLAAALNNRLNLWLARGDSAAAAADQAAFMHLARELGLWASEQHGRYNLALVDYQRGAFDAARAGLARARAVEARHPTDEAFASAIDALDARLRLVTGDAPGAARLAAQVRTRATSPGPWLDVQLGLVELALRGAPATAWSALEARALEHSLNDEWIEAAELRGLDAARSGRTAEARACLREALARARRHPNFTAARIRHALARLPEELSVPRARPAHSDRA